jgi:hypothetical protein
MGQHPEAKVPLVLYNKAVCELQCGMFSDASKSAKACVDILKEFEKKSGGNILKLSK